MCPFLESTKSILQGGIVAGELVIYLIILISILKIQNVISVYHDLGNLNVSFMSSKARHNRKANLLLLCDVVKDALGVDLEVNSRLGKGSQS